MTKQFNEIPKDHPAYNPEKRLFRFHSGETVHESVARAMEVTDIESVKTLIRALGLPFENVTVEPYAYDDRIGWLTYLVCIDGKAVGYTNHSLQQTYEESLPNLIRDIGYFTLKLINDSLIRIAWMQYCIQEISAGTSTYEELWEEEGGREEMGTMWYIHAGNRSAEVSINNLRRSIEQEYHELMGYCETKTWADTKIVLGKFHEFNTKGLDLHFEGLE